MRRVLLSGATAVCVAFVAACDSGESAAQASTTATSESLLANATSYLDMSRHIATAMDEQKSTAHYIMDNSRAITELISRIQENTASHEHAAGKVSERFERLLDSARDAARRIQHLGEHLRQTDPTDAP